MAELKHTPGPWGYCDEGPKDVTLLRKHWKVGVNCGAGVALVFRSEANAQLISAAPELLQACKDAIAAIKGREHTGFLEKAIAKAEGSSNG